MIGSRSSGDSSDSLEGRFRRRVTRSFGFGQVGSGHDVIGNLWKFFNYFMNFFQISLLSLTLISQLYSDSYCKFVHLLECFPQLNQIVELLPSQVAAFDCNSLAYKQCMDKVLYLKNKEEKIIKLKSIQKINQIKLILWNCKIDVTF